MPPAPTAVLIAALAVTVPLAAQNELWHYDGTTEFVSRGSNPSGGRTLLQRIPGDQRCGAATIVEVLATIQDQNVGTIETVSLVIRRAIASGPLAGAPDLSAAGAIAAQGPVALALPPSPGGTVGAVALTFAFSPPLALPPASPASGPVADVYAGIQVQSAPSWPADGLGLHTSAALAGLAGEQMSPATPGYQGVPGAAALGWEASAVSGSVAVSAGNRAWAVRVRFLEDVLQPYAANPAVFGGGGGAGLDPNFGYAGIFPDMLRAGGPDAFGFRIRTSHPPGATAMLFVGVVLLPVPLSVPGYGAVCLDPLLVFPAPFTPWSVATTSTPSISGTASSEALFGAFPGSPLFAGGRVHAQVLSISAGAIRLSSLASIRF